MLANYVLVVPITYRRNEGITPPQFTSCIFLQGLRACYDEVWYLNVVHSRGLSPNSHLTSAPVLAFLFSVFEIDALSTYFQNRSATMSGWNAYVDTQLVATGAVCQAGIFGKADMQCYANAGDFQVWLLERNLLARERRE